MKRPKILTVFCIIGYLSILITFPQVFSPSIKKIGLFVPAIYGLIVASQFIGCVGVWFYKRWGADLYIASFFIKCLFHLVTDTAGGGLIFSALLNLVFFIFLLRYYKLMNANL